MRNDAKRMEHTGDRTNALPGGRGVGWTGGLYQHVCWYNERSDKLYNIYTQSIVSKDPLYRAIRCDINNTKVCALEGVGLSELAFAFTVFCTSAPPHNVHSTNRYTTAIS